MIQHSGSTVLCHVAYLLCLAWILMPCTELNQWSYSQVPALLVVAAPQAQVGLSPQPDIF